MSDFPQDKPLYTGDALSDLHGGKGTSWVKDPVLGYWPDCCDEHRPESKRVGHKAASPVRKPRDASGPVIPPRSASEEIDERTALRLLATWLKRLAKEKQ